MAEGITCYERDEALCKNEWCPRVGCIIRNHNRIYDIVYGIEWKPINTAPVPATTKINPRTYKFRCLIQNKLGEVAEGEAHYVQVSRSSVHWVLHWYVAQGRKLCKPQPIYWMPMPAPRKEQNEER